MRPVTPHRPFDVYRTAPPPWRPPARRGVRGPWIHVALFAVTFVTTSMAGAYHSGVDPFADPMNIRAGLPFAITLLSILLVHELGHYSLARYHRVRASLPYFIPAPPFFIAGTFGAFIRMQSPPPDRRSLFDVGAAGPWAGLVVAIPAVMLGLHLSEVRPLGMEEAGWVLGDSLLFTFLSELVLGRTPDEVTILLHPIALAGWFGLFVTSLNLLPAGQLDGGHITYALFGRFHRLIARTFVIGIAILGTQGWPGWFVWVFFLFVIGIDHPPTYDATTPLDFRRQIAGWLTIFVFVITFMPAPITLHEPSPIFEGERLEVSHHTAPTGTGRFLFPLRITHRTRGALR